MDRYTSLLCATFQLLQSYLWFLPCLVCEFWWTSLSTQVCCGAIFFPFCDDGFRFQDIFFLLRNPDLIFSTALSLTCLKSSLVFMMLFTWWFLFTGIVEESVAFQNGCIYTEFMWHLDCTHMDLIHLIMWLLKVNISKAERTCKHLYWNVLKRLGF